MDFTYLVGLVLAAVVGGAVQLVLLVTRRDARFGLRATFATALVLNLLLLIDWRAFGRGLSSFDALALVADLILIQLITFVGVLFGALPVLLVMGVCRKVFALGRKNAES